MADANLAIWVQNPLCRVPCVPRKQLLHRSSIINDQQEMAIAEEAAAPPDDDDEDGDEQKPNDVDRSSEAVVAAAAEGNRSDGAAATNLVTVIVRTAKSAQSMTRMLAALPASLVFFICLFLSLFCFAVKMGNRSKLK